MLPYNLLRIGLVFRHNQMKLSGMYARSQISHWLGKIDAEASPGYYKVTSVSNR